MQVSYRYFLKYIIANLDKLDDLMALAAEFAAAATIMARWEIIKKIGDLFANATMPEADTIAAFEADDIEALEAKVMSTMHSSGNGYAAAAWNGTRLRNLFDTLLPVLIQILPILIK